MSGFIRQMASDRFLLRVAVVAAIGGFLFGHDTGVIGGALLFIKSSLHAQSNLAQQSIVASLLVGAIAGALAGGWLHTQLPWIGLAALLLYIASFAIGIGPVFWLMISEIYPTSIRGPRKVSPRLSTGA